MPDVAAVLKEEISRLARKEARQAADPLKKQIADLRRRLRDTESVIAKLETSTKRAVSAVADIATEIIPVEEEVPEVRIRKGSVLKHRQRLGLTQVEMATLLGVTPQSIVRWEKGQTTPRGASRQAFAALREMGVREVRVRLDAE